jgi:hypothetical protein
VRRPSSHEADGHALVDDALFDHHFAIVEVGGHERRDLHRCIGLGALEEEQLVGGGLFEIDDDGERLVVDDHRIGRVGRGRTVFGDDRRDRLTHEAHDVLRQHRPQVRIGHHAGKR